MWTTLIAIAAFLAILAVWITLWAWLLLLGLFWAKVPGVTPGRIAYAVFLVLILQAILAVIWNAGPYTGGADSRFWGVMQSIVAVLVPSVVIVVVFKVNFLRALQAWLPTLLMVPPGLAFMWLAFRPFVMESYSVPTNAMAPTILGEHRQGVCETCGGPAFGAAPHADAPAPDAPTMICSRFHATQPKQCGERVFHGDRILVAKYLKPQRWDLIVFRYPGDPSVNYVKRVVGLPGETITIKDGYAWADGKRLTPPDSLRGLGYLSTMPYHPDAIWGAPERPAKLGPDECFVLGDFSVRSKDSRLWVKGARGHPPFAVPQSHVCGVVTHIYWPAERWRILR